MGIQYVTLCVLVMVSWIALTGWSSPYMYGICVCIYIYRYIYLFIDLFTYALIYPKNDPNVGKYSIPWSMWGMVSLAVSEFQLKLLAMLKRGNEKTESLVMVNPWKMMKTYGKPMENYENLWKTNGK